MGVVSLDQLNKEMVLASDVKDLNGRLLAVKGARLTNDHLRIFKMWGVVEANIEGVSSKDAEDNALARLNPELLEAAEKLVRPRFAHSDLNQPATQKLFQLCIIRTADKLNRGEQLIPPATLRAEYIENNPKRSSFEKTNYRIDPVKFVQGEVSLPVLPGIVFEMIETLRDPKSSPKQIADVIGRDIGLSARILRLVNTPFYGLPSKIDTLSRAVLILGTKQLATLATGIKLLTYFESIPSSLVNMRSFLDHSITCGILSKIIGAYKNSPNTERLLLGGLLHDVGRLVLYSLLPRGAKRALVEAGGNHDLLHKTEVEIFGCDHAKVGGLLMKKWKLPVSLDVAVAYHHAPHEYRDPLEASIVHLADVIANAVEAGSSGERLVPDLSKEAWENIGLPARILPAFLDQMESEREMFLSRLVSGA